MVTKQLLPPFIHERSSVLAKILMVTKLRPFQNLESFGSVLAKILMVTKPDVPMLVTVWLFCSSKNPYGNKTVIKAVKAGI